MTNLPRVSIATCFSYEIPIEEQIPLVAKAGFSLISLGGRAEHSGYLEPPRRSDLRRRLSDHGLAVDSIHARDLSEPDARKQATATALAAAEFHAPCVVAHLGPFESSSEACKDRLNALISTCRELSRVARDTGVSFALENVMPGPATDLVRAVLHELDPQVFGLCYDSSHDQIDGPRPFDLIDEFAGRIFAVHLSDRVRAHVDHVTPGEGYIAWPEMCAKLRSAQYRGPILMEVMMTHSSFRDVKSFLHEAHKAAGRTWNLIHG